MADEWGAIRREQGIDSSSTPSSLPEVAEAASAPVATDDDARSNTEGDGIRWAHNAAVYEYPDDVGDVAPRFSILENQLFGKEVRCQVGRDFEAISNIEVTQEGSTQIKPVMTFEGAGLHPVMLDNLQLANFSVPTPVQQYVLPAVFLDMDIVASAQAGSGKTGAFMIPVLSKLMGKADSLCAPRPKANGDVSHGPFRAEPLFMVIVPNRELAVQIFDEARRFCYRSKMRPVVVYGGAPKHEQLSLLMKGCDVLIATPGRLVDVLTNNPNVLNLSRVKYIVLDEADEMLERDWGTDLETIIGNAAESHKGKINFLMFSATFPETAQTIANQYLSENFVRITVGRSGSSHINIKQDVIDVEESVKKEALVKLLEETPKCRTIIFVNSIETCDMLDQYLHSHTGTDGKGGFPVTSVHSKRTQAEREGAIRAFRAGKLPIMIATSLASRGLDIKEVMHVIQYDLPRARNNGIDEYTHRIGRTGRIGNRGLATAFFSDRNSDIAADLVKVLEETGQTVYNFLREAAALVGSYANATDGGAQVELDTEPAWQPPTDIAKESGEQSMPMTMQQDEPVAERRYQPVQAGGGSDQSGPTFGGNSGPGHQSPIIDALTDLAISDRGQNGNFVNNSTVVRQQTSAQGMSSSNTSDFAKTSVQPIRQPTVPLDRDAQHSVDRQFNMTTSDRQPFAGRAHEEVAPGPRFRQQSESAGPRGHAVTSTSQVPRTGENASPWRAAVDAPKPSGPSSGMGLDGAWDDPGAASHSTHSNPVMATQDSPRSRDINDVW